MNRVLEVLPEIDGYGTARCSKQCPHFKVVSEFIQDCTADGTLTIAGGMLCLPYQRGHRKLPVARLDEA